MKITSDTEILELLEPRIMLDANLDWAISGDANVDQFETIEAMTAFMQEYEDQFDLDQADGLIAKLQKEITDNLGEVSTLFSLKDNQVDAGFGNLTDIFERVQSAGLQLVEDYRADLRNVVADNDAVISGKIADEFSTSPVMSQVNGVVNLLKVYDSVTVNGEVFGLGFDLADYLSSTERVQDIFGGEALWNGDLEQRVTTFVNSLTISGQNPPTGYPEFLGLDAATKTALSNIIFDGWKEALTSNSLMAASIDALQQADLYDVADNSGTTYIFYAQTSVNEVSVTVNLAEVETLLDNLDIDPNLKAILPIDFEFPALASEFSFDLTASTTADQAQLLVGNFGLTNDALFTFGDAELVDPSLRDTGGNAPANYKVVYNNLPSMSLGFLSGTLQSIETAHFGVFANNMNAVEYTLQVNADGFTTGSVTETLTGIDAVEFVVMVDALDGAALQLVDLAAMDVFDLVRYNVSAELPLSLAASANAFNFNATLTQSGSFNGFASTGAQISGIPQQTSVSLGLDQGSVLENGLAVTAAKYAQLEQLSEALFQTTAETITQFLAGLGDGVSGILDSSDLSLPLPLVNIDLVSAFSDIADQFDQFPLLFKVDQSDLGFPSGDINNPQDAFSSFVLSLETLSLTGETLSENDILNLASLKTLTLNVYPGFAMGGNSAGAGQSTGSPIPVTVDLSAINPFNAFGDIDLNFLAGFAGQLSAALAAHGWSVSVTPGSDPRLNFTASTVGANPPKIFTIASATDRNDAAKVVNLADFGVVKAQTGTLTDDAGTDVSFLNADQGQSQQELQTLNINLLRGLSTLTLDVSIDGIATKVQVQQPTNGWGIIGGTPSPLESVIDEINSAFDLKGIELDVQKNSAADGLKFVLEANSEHRYEISVAEDTLTRAQDLKGLMAWMTNELANAPCMPAFTFTVDVETGEFLLSFTDPMEKQVSVTGEISLADAGFGELQGVNLQAQLAGSIVAQLDMSAGFNIFDIQNQYNQDPGADNAIRDAVFDNSFLTDLSLNAVLDAKASNLVASANIGMIEVNIGGDPNPNDGTPVLSANENFVRINTEVDLTIVGQQNDEFSNRLSATQMLALAQGAGTPGARLVDLIGRADIVGGIAIDADGCPVDANGVKIDDFTVLPGGPDLLTIANGPARVDGQDYAMLVFNFEAPSLDLGGLIIDPGVLSALDTSMTVSVGNIFKPLETTKLCHEFGQITCLTLLDPATIIDALVGFGQLLEAYSENLTDNFSVLNLKVPLLNESLLSAFDFVTEFNNGLSLLQESDVFSYATIENLLESIFGDDTVAITFNTDNGACQLLFDLNLEYLDDFTQAVPFNLSLEGLLGAQGLSDLLDNAGAAGLKDVMTSLVDARVDAELIIDPRLGLDLSFGFDLHALSTLSLGLAQNDTVLSELASVYGVATNGLGQTDLRIDWRDDTTGESKTFLFDFDKIINDANTLNQVVDIDHIKAAINAKLTDGLSVEFDTAKGTFTLVDPDGTARDVTGVNGLFNGVQSIAGADYIALTVGQSYTPREIAMATNIDYTAAYKFDVGIGDTGKNQEISLAADATRTEGDFVTALNQILQNTLINRGLISDTALIGTKVALSQLLRVTVDATSGDLKLVTTNFAQHNGYNEFSLAVNGNDISHDVKFVITEIENSNMARALGFKSGLTYLREAVGGAVHERSLTTTDPVVFIDTDKTNISAELSLGTPEGLNMIVALGPIEASIENGSAFIGASGGDGRGYIKGSIQDIDGQDDHKYDLVNLYEISQETKPDFYKLFGLDVDFETRVDLPFSGAFGLLDPDDHGFVYQSTLLRTIGDPADPNNNVVSASEFVNAVTGLTNPTDLEIRDALLTFFEGDAKSLLQNGYVSPFSDADRPATVASGMALPSDYYDASTGVAYGPHFYELKLPGAAFGDLGCSTILELVNNPLAIVNGLDTIMATIQNFVDDYLSAVDLPIIGDALQLASNFFDDFRFEVLDGARGYLEAPKANGELPTTLDLINVFINDTLQTMLNTSGQNFVAAGVNTDDTDHPYIYGAMAFDFEIFNEFLDLGFDLDIPGLNLDVDSGSAINLSSVLTIDLAFGVDCNGFFVLNDIDAAEAAITFLADASTFTGEMNIGGVLNAKASAVQQSGIQNGATQITASMGFDLFGDAGNNNGRAYDFTEANLQNLNLAANRSFENTVYIGQIDFADFAEFVFNANVDVHLDLEVSFNGIGNVIPTLLTDFIFSAGYNLNDGALINHLEFHGIRLDVSSLIDIVKPVLDPLSLAVDPIANIFEGILGAAPISYLRPALVELFPVLKISDQINQVYTILDEIKLAGNTICIGHYDFLGGQTAVPLKNFNIGNAVFSPCVDATFTALFQKFSEVGGAGPAILFNFPLLTDPTNALNLMLGKFDQVDIITTTLQLLDVHANQSITAEVLAQLNAPGWVSSIIGGGFHADLQMNFRASLTAGYDMSGIVNFANSFDPERLLDGVFLESQPGALVDGKITGGFSLNAGLAGASGGLGGQVLLSFNDPNSDGKLRIPELLKLLEFSSTQTDPQRILGAIFKGQVDFSAFLSVWAGISLPWPLPDLSWDTTLFNENLFSYSLPDARPTPEVAEITNGTAWMNLGARAGANLSSVSFDGHDYIDINGNGAYSTEYYANGQRFNGTNTFGGVSGIIIPAGEGNNFIELSGITSSIATVTYAGNGSDTIILPPHGTHVVFAGGGADNISVPAGATGTYYIFAEDGADIVNIHTSGKSVIFADDDFEMREYFLRTFNNGGLTEAAINSAINGANFKVSNAPMTLAQVQAGYTEKTQVTASRDIEHITVGGNGDHVVLTGKGNDVITVNSGAGQAYVYAGAGNDEIRVNGKSSSFIEGGAGADLMVFTGSGTNTAYGWGAAGQAGNLNHLMNADGNDIMIGGDGVDTFYGQFGKDILGGGNGDDLLHGGRDNDLISGGILKVSSAATGLTIDLSTNGALKNLQSRLIVETEILADGTDIIYGGDNNDVLFGGGGNDTLRGDAGRDILIGDYGKISISANRIAETFISTGINETTGGLDILDGGAGGDILVAGGSGNVTDTEIITDLLGNNVIFGDFGITQGARILENVTAYRSIASDKGTADIITTGNGNDVIIGGERSDIINAGLGGDVVIGDLGSFAPGKGEINNDIYDPATGTVITNTSLLEGNDVINLGGLSPQGDLIDIVLGGGGDDKVTAQDGGVIFVGDYGRMTLNPESIRALFEILPLPVGIADTDPRKIEYDRKIALIERIVASITTVDDLNAAIGDFRSGDDTIETVSGTVYAILGGGKDKATLGDGLSYIITDDGRLSIVPTASPGATAPDHAVITGEAISTALAGDDMVITSTGRDIILTGDGADIIDAGEGTNFVLTDNGKLETSDDLTKHPTTITSVEGAGDGIDNYTGGNDEDYVVLGGRSDIADLENGTNYLIADSGEIKHRLFSDGSIELAMTSNQVTVGHLDGNDNITTGNGEDFIILGLGADMLNAGEGRNAAIASAGAMNYTRNAVGDTTLSMISQLVNPGAVDGDDTVIMGSGDAFVILGLGADNVTNGNGENHIIGGEGSIMVTKTVAGDKMLSMASQVVNPLAKDGNENITTGSGKDFIILGLGDDVANVGDGRNRIVGDGGEISENTATGQETVASTNETYGGNDVVTTGKDADILVLGAGADRGDTNAGEDILVGDNARITKNGTGKLHNLDVSTSGSGGEDILNSGADNDIVVGGSGADQIMVGSGDDFALGDFGNLTFRNDTDIASLTNTSSNQGGDDVLTATGSGDNILIGQYGNDVINGGQGDDWLIGDVADMTFSDPRTAADGQSAFDRVKSVTFTEPGVAFNDLLFGHDGNDFLMGGFGNDILKGGKGQDFLFGDTIQINRTIDPVTRIESFLAETNYAFTTGGYDILDGEEGHDILIGGLGPDLFFGNTADDFLIGDAFAGLFRTKSPFDFTAETPFRQLITVNFPTGPNATDILSYSQVSSSLGLRTQGNYNSDGGIAEGLQDLTEQQANRALAGDIISSFFANTDVFQHISELIYYNVDTILILEDILQIFGAYMSSSAYSTDNIEYHLLELRLLELIEKVMTEQNQTTIQTLNTETNFASHQ